ncbi:hypothetical protein HK104_011298 [Borealophlyctis nickersoniae]|nr:hypothetical protein HK104_011298 [Borealophlyctis nickersoniae]
MSVDGQANLPATGVAVKLSLSSKTKKLGTRSSEHFEAHDGQAGASGPKDEPELIKEIEGRTIHTVITKETKGPLVIPLLKQNVWRNLPEELRRSATPEVPERTTSGASTPQKRVRSRSPSPSTVDTPREVSPVQMKAESDDQSSPAPSKWGLQLRKKRKVDTPASSVSTPAAEKSACTPRQDCDPVVAAPMSLEEEAMAAVLAEAAGGNGEDDTKLKLLPILAQNAVPGLGRLEDEAEKYRHDVKLRPEEATLEDYERVPIEEFGQALLRGMGWETGKPVGKNPNGLVEPIMNKPRPHLLGLGATPAPPEKKEKKYIKPGEKREPDTTLDVPKKPSKDDLPRSKQQSPNRKEDKRGKEVLRPGVVVRITAGSNKGCEGMIVEVKERSSGTVAKVKLNKSDEIARVWLDELKPLGHKIKSEAANGSSRNGSSSLARRSWLRPHIRLRIVSKSFKGGRFYNKKCVVQDVVTMGECIARLESGDILEGLMEKHVETYIPNVDKTIIVVQHQDRELVGQTGRLKEKDSGKERAAVQMDHSLDYHTFSYDEICELVEEY